MFQTNEHLVDAQPTRTASLSTSALGLLSQTEVAAVLGVSMPYLRRMQAADPSFPVPFRLGKRLCVRLEDLQRWADRSAQTANDGAQVDRLLEFGEFA